MAPSARRRGRSRHRWPCQVSAVAQCVCAGGSRPPARSSWWLHSSGQTSAPTAFAILTHRIAMLSGLNVRDHAHRSRSASIAPLSLAPCSASSMLCAPLRPGLWPGLRALTTPARGTVLALARCWQFLDGDSNTLRNVAHEVDAAACDAYSAAIVGVSRHHPPLRTQCVRSAFGSSLFEHNSNAITGSLVVIALEGSRAEPMRTTKGEHVSSRQ